jgi:hypothetical protein
MLNQLLPLDRDQLVIGLNMKQDHHKRYFSGTAHHLTF